MLARVSMATNVLWALDIVIMPKCNSFTCTEAKICFVSFETGHPQLTRADQHAHVTNFGHDIYIQLMVSCLLRGIIWQLDKQTDRQTDKQSVGYGQRSHCQSHCHSVPLSSPTAMGQYLSRQSASLPNIEQHAVSVFFPSAFWTRFLGCVLLLLVAMGSYEQLSPCYLLLFVCPPF